jgi:rSAM/selenodomain-associated transferase 1
MPSHGSRVAARIAVVLPALNEEAVVGQQVRAIRAHPALRALPVARVLVVDNGSTDATAARAREAGAEVVTEQRRGYGYACRAGILAADDAEILLLMDADGSDDLDGAAHVARMVLDGEADLAMGARSGARSERGALTPQQVVGNAVGAVLLRLLYGVRVSDIGPVRAIRRETLLRLEMSEMTYGWSAEMLAKAGRLGLTIRETPVASHRRAGGQSKVAGTLSGTLKASARILGTIARYVRWRPAEGAGTSGGIPRESRRARPRRALFIVARLPIPGQAKTRLGSGVGLEAAAALYGAFLRDLGERFRAAAGRDGYDLYWLYSAPDGVRERAFAACVPPGAQLILQEGDDLGERLWHGFQALSRRGYDDIVVVGSDSPHLPAAYVRRAFHLLATADVVIGPAEDGGYYLLGQRAASAPVDLFTSIEMSTPRVYDQTLDLARRQGVSVAFVPATFDIDEASQLPRLAAILRSAPTAEADPAPATLGHLERLGAHDREMLLAERATAGGADHGAD